MRSLACLALLLVLRRRDGTAWLFLFPLVQAMQAPKGFKFGSVEVSRRGPRRHVSMGTQWNAKLDAAAAAALLKLSSPPLELFWIAYSRR